MRYFVSGFALAALLMAAAPAPAQDKDKMPAEESHNMWMKHAGGNGGKIKRELEAGNFESSIQLSKDMALNFKHVELFWKDRGPEDAQNFAKDITSKALEVAVYAEHGNKEAALKTHGEMMANCGGCHKAHRDKDASGKYIIK